MNSRAILIGGDNRRIAGRCLSLLRVLGQPARECSRDELVRQAGNAQAIVLIAGTTADLDVLGRIGNTPPIAVLAEHSTEAIAVQALRARVREYIRIPEEDGELEPALRRLAGANATCTDGIGSLVGRSSAILEIQRLAMRVAAVPSTVLITGETGAGKEPVARLLHENGPRRDRPFVTVNCAAIPEGLLESELFGRERGSYTGAAGSFEGKLKVGDGGTVFLDEIAELPLAAQAKILRAIEAKEAQRLGAKFAIRFDVRFVAATNRNLLAAVREGSFRADLYYRLQVVQIHVPPLRERKEDISPLLRHFVATLSRDLAIDAPPPAAELVRRLESHDWPGNVRELRNFAEWYVVQCMDGTPDPASFSVGTAPAPGQSDRERLLTALESTRWNKAETARRLRWSRMTVYRKMAAYNIVDSSDANL